MQLNSDIFWLFPKNSHKKEEILVQWTKSFVIFWGFSALSIKRERKKNWMKSTKCYHVQYPIEIGDSSMGRKAFSFVFWQQNHWRDNVYTIYRICIKIHILFLPCHINICLRYPFSIRTLDKFCYIFSWYLFCHEYFDQMLSAINQYYNP